MSEDGWKVVEAGNAVSLGDKPAKGDKPAQVKTAGGLLVKIEYDQGPKSNSAVYEFVQADGDSVRVWGSVAIDNKLSPAKIGKFIHLEFTGIEQSKSGDDFKAIKVSVYEGVLTDKIKERPRVEEWYAADDGVKPMDGEEDDDLPF